MGSRFSQSAGRSRSSVGCAHVRLLPWTSVFSLLIAASIGARPFEYAQIGGIVYLLYHTANPTELPAIYRRDLTAETWLEPWQFDEPVTALAGDSSSLYVALGRRVVVLEPQTRRERHLRNTFDEVLELLVLKDFLLIRSNRQILVADKRTGALRDLITPSHPGLGRHSLALSNTFSMTSTWPYSAELDVLAADDRSSYPFYRLRFAENGTLISTELAPRLPVHPDIP